MNAGPFKDRLEIDFILTGVRVDLVWNYLHNLHISFLISFVHDVHYVLCSPGTLNGPRMSCLT